MRAMRKIATGSGMTLEYAGGTPLPISKPKVSTPFPIRESERQCRHSQTQ